MVGSDAIGGSGGAGALEVAKARGGVGKPGATRWVVRVAESAWGRPAGGAAGLSANRLWEPAVGARFCPGVAAFADLVAGVRALSLNGGGADDANRRVAGPCALDGVAGRPVGGAAPGARGRTGPFPSPPGGVFLEFTDQTPRPRPTSFRTSRRPEGNDNLAFDARSLLVH